MKKSIQSVAFPNLTSLDGIPKYIGKIFYM